MTQEQQAIYNRGVNSHAVQVQIILEWEWSEKPVAAWVPQLAAIIAQDEVMQDHKAQLDGVRGDLEEVIGEMGRLGRQVLGLARTRYRHDPDKLRLFRNAHFDSNGRDAILNAVIEVESAWEQADAGWVPFTLPPVPPAAGVPLTLALFKSKRLATRALVDLEKAKARALDDEEIELNRQCRELNDDNVAFYADGTTLFAEGTPTGDLIRTIPTTYTPPVDPPGACGFTHIESAAPGEATVGVSAPGATHYKLWHMGPSDTEWVLVLDNSESGEYSETGLEPGDHRYKGQGFNSGGAGGESEEQTVSVG